MACVLGLNSVLPAAWVGNNSESGAAASEGGEKSDFYEGFIIDGASYFLKSYADIFLLLNESEIGLKNGFNLDQAHQLINSALDKLIFSEENYSMALIQIKKTVFAETWLSAVKTFDYKRLTVLRRLHPDVMGQVAAFLTGGDVIGLYQHMMDSLKNMKTTLQTIGQNTNQGILPDMEALRSLYQ
jgi:hypothetical protein